MLSAIVVNFRSHQLVNDCLRALLDGTRPPDEIVVIDNEATDGALLPELATDGRIRLEMVAGNPGYAASCDRGAVLASGDGLLFANADVTVTRDTLERCLAALDSDESIGIVTPRLVLPDGSMDHACHRGLPTPASSLAYALRLHRVAPRSRRLAHYTMGWLDPRTDHDVEACTGAFLLIRRADLEAAGGWDVRYRFYGEDLDLCLRVGRLGRRIRYLGSVTAVHRKGTFRYRGQSRRQLDPAQLAVQRWTQRQAIASHRLFFQEHQRADALLPTRWAIELLFRLQELRLHLAERLDRR